MPELSPEEIRRAVEERYGTSARQHLEWREAAGDTLPAPGPGSWAAGLYSDDELASLPAGVASFAVGCGNPTSIAELQKSEAVLDMGSGNGIDCFLAARLVSSSGRVTGLDFSDDMVDLARRNVDLVGATNVEFRQGDLESMPFQDSTFDVIISNCVVNLTPNKEAVLREAFRVLKPGGRLRIADIVWTKAPTQAENDELANWTGCVAALEADEYAPMLTAVGFVAAELNVRQVSEIGYASAYVRAVRPR